ncbi:MAG: imidazolonepropionase [Acidobacteria bacterium]|nr:imidazolonepropionase [Acidobacteriota bacterium]MCW5967211.1 imidazolonepropionase [Blastocatellales bacterium]
MKRADLLINNAAGIVTCASVSGPRRGSQMSEIGFIASASIAVQSGIIVAAGPADEIASTYDSNRNIDAAGRMVIPGFVDPHTHAVFSGNRLGEFEQRISGASYLDILASGGGIHSTTRATRSASADDLIRGSLPHLVKMLELGTTALEVKTGYGLDVENELKLLEVIAELDRIQPIDLVPTFMPAHAVPPEFAGHTIGYVDLIIEEMLPAAMEWYERSHFSLDNRPFFIDVFCEQNAFDLLQSERVLAAGRALGMKVKAHVNEFTNLGGASMAVALGAVSIDHLDANSPEDIDLIAASPAVAVITPAVNFNLASRHYADARSLIDAGAALALTTDFNPGSAPCYSMPLVMAIACRYCCLTPNEALIASTINAAYAAGIGDRVGSIEVGKQSDLLIVDIGDVRQLSYEMGGNPVEIVIKKGEVVCGDE